MMQISSHMNRYSHWVQTQATQKTRVLITALLIIAPAKLIHVNRYWLKTQWKTGKWSNVLQIYPQFLVYPALQSCSFAQHFPTRRSLAKECFHFGHYPPGNVGNQIQKYLGVVGSGFFRSVTSQQSTNHHQGVSESDVTEPIYMNLVLLKLDNMRLLYWAD